MDDALAVPQRECQQDEDAAECSAREKLFHKVMSTIEMGRKHVEEEYSDSDEESAASP